MVKKSTFRLLARKMQAAKDNALLDKMAKEYTLKEAYAFRTGDVLVFDGNLEAVRDLLEDKGWKEDSNGSDYSVMTRDGDAVKAELDADGGSVTVQVVDHPDPNKVEASFLTDPADETPRIGDRPLKVTNNGQLPSIPVSGGEGGGGVAVQPSPDPTEDPPVDIDPQKYSRLYRNMLKRRGQDEHGNLTLLDPDGEIEKPGAPIDTPQSMSDSPIFMADQPWGYNPNSPLRREEQLDIQEVDPNQKDNVLTVTDIPIGTVKGTRPMPIGDKYMAKASTRIAAARKSKE